MKNKPMYHIDVTPEEDRLFRPNEPVQSVPIPIPNPKPNPKSIASVIILIVVLHLAGACALMAFSSNRSISKEDKQFVGEAADHVLNSPVIEQPAAIPSPTATPIPAPKPTPEPTPPPANNDVPMDGVVPKPIPKLTVKPVEAKHPTLTKEYVVKKGDTIYSIAKKFKLNTQKLLKLNSIKDPSKIFAGQKLKFM